MSTAMLLTKPQAHAVYNAMCALNDISAQSGVQVSFVDSSPDDLSRLSVHEDAGGAITVTRGPLPRPVASEQHASPADFAAAYALQ